MRLSRFATLLGTTACILVACSSTSVPDSSPDASSPTPDGSSPKADGSSPTPDASTSDAPSGLDVTAHDAPSEATAEGGPEASVFDAEAEAASDASVGPDATDAHAGADATDDATLGACSFPYNIECSWVIYSDPEGGPSSPTWDQASKKLTFHMTISSHVLSGIAWVGGGDGGSTTLPVVPQGNDLVVDLTSILADPSVKQVVITELDLNNQAICEAYVGVGGPGGYHFDITIQRTPPYLISSGCVVNA
jgi:hypothetical protein